ncbi:ABC transporter ATP-binding protein [Neoactinobaculum massilliense]|uniref:ABC transporter ATP-binding protein n=1 Tax=Neoactinobaculum massilliense TaxID=2364794 RepID=UPI000F536BBA|nr:ABC transporter ATP-binding protein [Neoactinobaculum massilliense]
MSNENHAPAEPGPAVVAHHLTKTYGTGSATVHALRDVSVQFYAGQFTAIMGPSGSGKSTLLHCLAGLDTVDGGDVSIGTRVLTRMNDDALTRLRRDHVGFVFQGFNLVPTLTARENIVLPVELAGKKVDTEWFDSITGILSIRDRLEHRPSELSGGEQQRVAIARALLTHPDVIFADEPTGALDSAAGTEVLSLLRRSSRELGQTIIMVTHDPGAAAYAHRVVLLDDGAITGDVFDPTPEMVLEALAKLGVA